MLSYHTGRYGAAGRDCREVASFHFFLPVGVRRKTPVLCHQKKKELHYWQASFTLPTRISCIVDTAWSAAIPLISVLDRTQENSCGYVTGMMRRPNCRQACFIPCQAPEGVIGLARPTT